MPRSSGTYSLPAGNPVVTGTTVSSTWANNTLADIGSALTQSISQDGQTPITGNLPMTGFRHTNVGAAVNPTDYARADQVQNSSMQYMTVTGTDTILGTVSSPAPTAYATGQTFRFIAAGTNATTAVTLNINSLGSKNVYANGAALLIGAIPSGALVELVYDGTQFELSGIYGAATLTGAINWASAVTLTSAATVNIGAAASNVIIISGSVTITAFDTIAAGVMRWVRFSGSPTLTYNATSMLLLGQGNITPSANDEAVFVSLGSGNWKCLSYTKYNGSPFIAILANYAATAVPGNLEYNGIAYAGTPSGTQRGIIPTEQLFRLASGLAGANVNTVQSIFGVGVTLSSNTVYEFEAEFTLVKSAGTTSHNILTGFGGTATLNDIYYDEKAIIGGALPAISNNSVYGLMSNTATATAFITAITSAAFSVGITMKGTVSILAGGTFIPQYTLSSVPGGAYTTAQGAFIKIKPLSASGSNTSVGTWA